MKLSVSRIPWRNREMVILTLISSTRNCLHMSLFRTQFLNPSNLEQVCQFPRLPSWVTFISAYYCAVHFSLSLFMDLWTLFKCSANNNSCYCYLVCSLSINRQKHLLLPCVDTYFGPGTVENIKCHLNAEDSKARNYFFFLLIAWN